MPELHELNQRQRLEKVSAVKGKIGAAEKELADLLREAFPIGDSVEWMHGHHIQYGEVLGHNADGLRVRNHGTGNTVHVSSYSMAEMYGHDFAYGNLFPEPLADPLRDAAPDMLAALTAVVLHVKPLPSNAVALNAVHRAIAKAEGRA